MYTSIRITLGSMDIKLEHELSKGKAKVKRALYSQGELPDLVDEILLYADEFYRKGAADMRKKLLDVLQ